MISPGAIHPTQPHWAVAVDRRDSPNCRERGARVVELLRAQGVSANLVEDGEPEGVEAEVLLFMENLADFTRYPAMLQSSARPRPFTAVWMLETLPPCGMSAGAEEEGLRAADWQRRLGLRSGGERADGGGWARLPLRLRRALYRVISHAAQRRVRARLVGEGVVQKDDGWKQVRGAFENWQVLQGALSRGWLDHCLVSTGQRRRFLQERQWAADYVPVGWHPGLGQLQHLQRDVEVLFLGYLRNDRRRTLLNELRRRLAARGVHLRVVAGNCHGEARAHLLNRTRIMLMLHQYSWSPAWVRFHLAASGGACVVSEPIADREPFAAGEHYCACPVEEMPDAIVALLRDEPRRASLAEAAHRLCTTRLTMENSVRTLAQAVERARSAWRGGARL